MNGLESAAADRDEALLISLPDAAQAADFHLQVSGFQTAEFGYAKARRIQEFDHGFIAQTRSGVDIGLGEEAVYLLHAKEFRERLTEFRRLDIDGRVFVNDPFGKSETEEVTNGYQVAGDGTAIQLAKIESAKEVHDLTALNLAGLEFLLRRKGRKFLHVPTVGLNGVRREPLFDSQIVQE